MQIVYSQHKQANSDFVNIFYHAEEVGIPKERI